MLQGPRCENCGEEAVEQGGAATTIFLCPRCRRRFRRIIAAHSAIVFAAFLGVFLVAMPLFIEGAEGTPATGGGAGRGLGGRELLAFYLALIVGMVVHESAHALSARGLGFTVTQVHFGSGPILLKGRVAGALVAVHLMPFAGQTASRQGGAGSTPGRRAAVAAAGPLSNVALAALLWVDRAVSPAILIPAAFANLLLAFENLLPRPSAGATGAPNDGWQVLKTLTRSRWDEARIRRAELGERLMELVGDGRMDAAEALLRDELQRAGGDHPDAEALLCALLLDDDGGPAALAEGMERSRRLIYDHRAFPGWRALALGDRAWMIGLHQSLWASPGAPGEAEWLAREANRLLPNNASAEGALALVLARLGRLREAEPHARAALRRRTQVVNAASGPMAVSLRKGLGAMHATLALIGAAESRTQDAHRELAETRSLFASCPLIPELERLLSAPAQGVTAVAVAPAAAPLAAVAPLPALMTGAPADPVPGEAPPGPSPPFGAVTAPARRAWAVPLLIELA
ncbi:MAG: site-2 protease family protein, partial [Acidobacteriota bacterium]|nr:site-2 protease family protein [Acidobacteriota bacterium]